MPTNRFILLDNVGRRADALTRREFDSFQGACFLPTLDGIARRFVETHLLQNTRGQHVSSNMRP